MRAYYKAVCIAILVMIAGAVHAQSGEAPPREPPYVDDSEFDPVQSEDPAASNDPISASSPIDDPIPSPKQQSEVPVVESAPRPSNRASRPPNSGNDSADSSQTYKPGTVPEKGVKLLHHPDAKKGLIRIEQDGSYTYKVKTKRSNETGIVRVGIMEPPKISAADGLNNFSTMYGGDGLPMVMGEYEWQPFSQFGKLGVQAGIGFATAEGNGFFLGGSGSAEEKYTFYAVPITLGAIYRLEYFRRQFIAPYVSGGVSYIGVAELRDDDKLKYSGTPGAYGAGGIMFNISALDRNLSFELSNQYGVANLWIIGEYRFQQAFSEELDFSGGIFSVGIGADF